MLKCGVHAASAEVRIWSLRGSRSITGVSGLKPALRLLSCFTFIRSIQFKFLEPVNILVEWLLILLLQ